MATRFFLRSEASSVSTADDDRQLQLTRGSGLTVENANSVTGPTSGVEINSASGNLIWFSNPINAVTVSSNVTLNVWMAESAMSANVGAQVTVFRADGSGAFISTVVNSEKGTELPVTTRAAQNWAGSTTVTSFAAGDRIGVVVLGNDVGTMATGFTFDLGFSGTTAAADGDSWIEFVETITEQAAAAANPPHRNPMVQLLAH